VTLGDLSKAVNAQNVLLSVNSPLEEVVTLYNIRHSSESILDRRNTRAGAIDTPSFTLDEITADCTISKDLYDHFSALRVLTSRGALPVDDFRITGEAISVVGDDVIVTGSYVLRRLEDVGQEQGRYDVTLTMRVTP
jgi:hypothetical protein